MVRKRGSTAASMSDEDTHQDEVCCSKILPWLPILGAYKTDPMKVSDDVRDAENSIHTSVTTLRSTQSVASDEAFEEPDPNLPFSQQRQMIGLKTKCYAIKSLHLSRLKSTMSHAELKREVALLRTLDHPNVVRVLETYVHRNRYFAVMELCRGGDLYTRDPYTEYEAWEIMSKLVDAVSYLHSHGIVHRDLKYENIMFADTYRDSVNIKLIDFGLATKFAVDDAAKDQETVGTVYTMAPEVFSGLYNSKVDIWSLGVIAFMLLSSTMPFIADSSKALAKKIKKGDFQFGSPRWQTVSDEAKEFCCFLLTYDPATRPSPSQVMAHSWLANTRHKQDDEYDACLDETSLAVKDAVQASMQTYAKYGTLKKLALLVVAYQSSVEELGFLRYVFSRIDQDHNGHLTRKDFRHALRIYGYEEHEMDELYDAIDLDGNDQVSFIEFLASTLEALGPIDNERLADAFSRIKNSSGYITIKSRK